MSNMEQLHWTASGRLLRSSVTKNTADRDSFGDHVFDHNSPIEHEHLLVVFFGILQNYFEGVAISRGAQQIQELWIGLWSDWKDSTSIHQKFDDFSLVETTYLACIRGSFISDATNQNSTSQARRALVQMASTPGSASLLPMLVGLFLEFAFDICDEGNAPFFRQLMKDVADHALK